MGGGHVRCNYMYCLCLARWVSFLSPSTVNSQSWKDIDLYFKYQLYAEDPGHRKPVLIFSNGLNKPAERAHDRNQFLHNVDRIRTRNLLIVSPVSYD